MSEKKVIIANMENTPSKHERHGNFEGDVIVFPQGKEGAHRITNTSESDMLVYLDCDTISAADVVFYPHSEKIGFIIDGQPNTFFESASKVDYYKGE